MEKFNNILKNVLIFFVVFLSINYLMQSCQGDKETLLQDAGNLVFITTKNEYNKTQIVTVEIRNNTDEAVLIPNECPNEPFKVYRYENNDWVQKTAKPELKCNSTEDIHVEAGEELLVPYEHWNNALFSEMGRFRIDFETTINGEKKTISTQEFIVEKEGIFKQLAIALFYRPIYNGLVFLIAIIPGHHLGLAIILLTLIIRTILLVPSQKAMHSQKRLQEIQPRLDKIKEKYKGDQQKIAMETMAIWKDAKINPMSSCLPMLMQFPFLIALFYVVKGGLNPDNAFLLYTQYQGFTLSEINFNFFNLLDLRDNNLYVLPLIVGGLQFIQMKLSIGRKLKTQKDQPRNEMAIANNMMMYFMPVMIAVFTASLPSGVGLYWGTSTLYGIFQQIVVNRTGRTSKDKEPTVKVIEATES